MLQGRTCLTGTAAAIAMLATGPSNADRLPPGDLANWRDPDSGIGTQGALKP